MILNKNFKIGKKYIGSKHKCLVVAEISANHNNHFNTVKKLISSAKKCGADLIKIQTYTADTITINAKKKDFEIKKKNPWSKKKYLWNLYKKAETSNKLTSKIFKYCKTKKIDVFSSPFDVESVNFLEKLNCPAYKIASPEITHIPLIEKVAKTKKPIILSLGLAYTKDIKLALKTIKKVGNNKIILLQCVSTYPAKLSDQNIRAIPNIENKYKLIAGLSDHTFGYIAPVSAVALGAKMIEKHFNIKNNKSIDSFFSTEENQFELMIKNIRQIEKTLGDGNISISKSALKNFNSRRSIYVSKNIKKGQIIKETDVKVVRPGMGLHPKYLKYILNKKCQKTLQVGDRFQLKYVKKK